MVYMMSWHPHYVQAQLKRATSHNLSLVSSLPTHVSVAGVLVINSFLFRSVSNVKTALQRAHPLELILCCCVRDDDEAIWSVHLAVVDYFTVGRSETCQFRDE